MAFHKAGPAKQAEAVTRHHEEKERRRAELTARLLAAYEAEPDREYARAFWGEMLRERGDL